MRSRSPRLLVLLAWLLPSWGCLPTSLPPVVPDALPDFALTTHARAPIRRADLLGKPWIANFIFTTCGGTCPAMSAQLARLRKSLPGDVRLISFTVDPKHDTPEVLAAYARPFEPGERWLFVTGAQSDLYRLAVDGFKLVAMEVPPDQRQPGDDGPFLHSTRFALVDAGAHVVGYYDSADPDELALLERDAQRLDRRARAWPKVNAGLNALSAALLLAGYALIRAGRRHAHRLCMLGACCASGAFLLSYLAYHARVGSQRFLGTGTLRTLYLTILSSHTLLALVIVPLVIMTLRWAWRGDFARHRRIARLTLPLWAYVSVTGVVVYWMVYQF